MDNMRQVLEFYREIGAGFLQIPRSKPGSHPGHSPQPPSLEELHREIHSCQKCSLHKTRNRCVPGEGKLQPLLMFVGEGPGADEDRAGRPFVGRAGRLLDRLIQKTGYRREDFFIGNIVKCRPPSNRNPLPEEIEACIGYLYQQIGIIQPRVLVCLGKVAMNSLLGQNLSIMKNHGQVFEFRGIPLVPTIHPSYILHKSKAGREAVSQAKWMMWNDIQVALSLARKE